MSTIPQLVPTARYTAHGQWVQVGCVRTEINYGDGRTLRFVDHADPCDCEKADG